LRFKEQETRLTLQEHGGGDDDDDDDEFLLIRLIKMKIKILPSEY